MAAGRPIVAVCGKGGVGKTAVTALLSRALLDAAVGPLLLVDADPLMGLTAAIGHAPRRTLGQVRDQVVDTLRRDAAGKGQVAAGLDYWVMEALQERDDHALLVMGRSEERGCYCPVHSLLRQAIDLVAAPFAAVLIDAEAGVEQVKREVTRQVTQVVAVIDGSRRALDTVQLLHELLSADGGEVPAMAVVANRGAAAVPMAELPAGVSLAAAIPEDAELRSFDGAGRPLWELPPENGAARSAAALAAALGLLAGGGGAP